MNNKQGSDEDELSNAINHLDQNYPESKSSALYSNEFSEDDFANNERFILIQNHHKGFPLAYNLAQNHHKGFPLAYNLAQNHHKSSSLIHKVYKPVSQSGQTAVVLDHDTSFYNFYKHDIYNNRSKISINEDNPVLTDVNEEIEEKILDIVSTKSEHHNQSYDLTTINQEYTEDRTYHEHNMSMENINVTLVEEFDDNIDTLYYL